MTISTFPPDRHLSLSSMHHEPRFEVEAKSDEFDLDSFWRILRRRITMVVVIVAFLTSAALIAIWDMKPIYRAESRLIIHKPLATTLSAEEAGRNEPLDLKSETERLLSRSIAERIIHDLRLDELIEFNPALRGTSVIGEVRKILRGLVDRHKRETTEQNSLELIIPEYYAALRVWRDGLGDVIHIGFEATDPQLAAAAPNKLISVYLEERNESIRHRLDAAEVWIRQRIEEQQKITDAARLASDAYREEMGALLSLEAPGEQLKSLAELNERQVTIAQNRADVAAAITVLEKADDAPVALNTLSLPENVREVAEEFRVQQRDLDRLLDTYDDGAQVVIDRRVSIAKSRAALGLAVERYLQSLRARLIALDQEYAAVHSDLATADEKRSRSVIAQAELVRFERAFDREQTALDKLEGQRRSLAGEAMLPGTEVEVLSPAAVPIGPQGRGRLFYLVSALIASTSLAITAAFLAELIDKKIRSFDQLTGITRIIPAGYIPRKKRRGLRNPLARNNDGFDGAIHDLANFLKQSNGGSMPASIVVTPTRSGDSGSLVARSLAMELVSTGCSVLLVDGNLGRGNLDAFFKSGLKRGLNDFLNGQAAISEIVHHDLQNGLDFIPSGKVSPSLRPTITGLAEIIAVARARGQIAVFTSAPASHAPEATKLSTLVDRTLMIVDWATINRRAVELNLRHLRGSRTTEILVAINGVDVKRNALYNFTDSEFSSRAYS
ncbi:exopolysaccharide biosynthesis protein (plasmid) [Aliirhizobium terrae]|uniref:GumC family protein n=1 Tax=Terrirhizobium terrae TaxID=2926709 RepID=UPI00257684A9|nr:tyrosine-protein kinase domain-containing protein [Rhizobium sp. CC-CFT758]WJH37623.1 exopolysaccharide biosynthesis protein [Rhizobium sp. CC-CFT758]